jgi:putative ABC transport system permease protein
VVVVCAAYLWQNYRRPLGFRYADVWNVGVDTDGETLLRMINELRSMDGVVAVSPVKLVPFDLAAHMGNVKANDRFIPVEYSAGDDHFPEVFDITLLHGRWFDRTDDGLDRRPIVIDADLALALFDTTDAVGKEVLLDGDEKNRTTVVGVITDYRRGGEFSGRGNFVFERIDVMKVTPGLGRNIAVRVRPGTTAAYEEQLIRRLTSIAPNASFEIKPLSQARASALRFKLVPLTIGAIISAFLALMVGLGLLGVLWQNVTQRTQEMGLRRAIGAAAGTVQRQILAELLVLTTLSLLIGTLIVIQVPLAGLVTFVPSEALAAGLVISLGVIYLLAALCGMYPSWLATRVQPAQALRSE